MITVTNLNDAGAGSLRQAILSAALGEEITFLVSGTINLTSGTLTITQNLTITGPGSGNLTINCGGGAFRAFTITGGVVVISGLTVTNGNPVGSGGGISNTATLSLSQVVVTANSTSGDGGGIWNNNTLTLIDCVVSNNTSPSNGGGMYNSGTVFQSGRTDFIGNISGGDGGGIWCTGTVIISGDVTGNTATGDGGACYTGGTTEFIESTISGNSQQASGNAIFNNFGTLTFTRSTVSDNTDANSIAINNTFGTLIIANSTISGNAGTAAIYNGLGAMSVTNSTITANNAIGIFQASGSFLEIYDTILAGNTGADLNSDTADVTSDGNNIFGTTTNPVTPGASDQFGLNYAALVIGPLQDNGGPTFTHALLPSSPAIDTGNNTSAPTTDQRGQPRITGTFIDIGSYEAAAACLSFTGTLPGWVSIDGNCLVGAAGTFRAATKAQANALAQAAFDTFIAAAIAAGQLTCNGEPPPVDIIDWSDFDGQSCAQNDDADNFYEASATATETHVVINGTAASNGNIVACELVANVINSVPVTVHYKWSGNVTGGDPYIQFCIGGSSTDCDVLNDGPFTPFVVTSAGAFVFEGDFSFAATGGQFISVNGQAVSNGVGDTTYNWQIELTVTAA